MSYDVYWMSINLCDIVIIEMKSQSKLTITKLSFIKPPKGALPHSGAFLHGKEVTMCEYCEKRKEIKSCNFCGRAKARIIGAEIDISGDEKKIRWFRSIYDPAFRINFCPMCGRKLESDKATTEQ